jgi:hypothetical protein
MAVRASHIAIAFGGACGAFAALVGTPSPPAPRAAPQPVTSLPPRPIGQLARPPGTGPAAAVSSETQGLSAPPSASASSSVSASASVSTSATSSASAAASAASSAPPTPLPVSSAELAPLPSTKEALLRAEMHCDQKDAAACILAARGFEAGSAGPSDSEKAGKYRKIALTLWLSQCDHNSAAACATLVDMYRTGRGVPQNEKNAAALLTRTRELCHYNDAPVCHDLPPAP